MNINITHAFAEPGSPSIIDVVNPETGRSAVYGETLDEIRQRYPTADLILLSDWEAARAAEQDTPITWAATTAEDYDDALNVLPPAFCHGGLLLVGEPEDHHAKTGEPRFPALRQTGSDHYVRYFRASRPITRREALAVLRGRDEV